MSTKFCNDTSHGGSSYMKGAFRCSRHGCGGIQAWRAHEEEARKEVLSELNRWEDHYEIPKTPTGGPLRRFTFLDDRLRRGTRRRGKRRAKRVGAEPAQRASVSGVLR